MIKYLNYKVKPIKIQEEKRLLRNKNIDDLRFFHHLTKYERQRDSGIRTSYTDKSFFMFKIKRNLFLLT